MNTSNTRAVTGLYMASYKTKNAIGGDVKAIAAFGKIDGQPQQLFSIVPRLNGFKIPALREIRGILEGRTVVLAAEVIAFEEQSRISSPVAFSKLEIGEQFVFLGNPVAFVKSSDFTVTGYVNGGSVLRSAIHKEFTTDALVTRGWPEGWTNKRTTVEG